jgi:hypothetical protein
MIAQIAELGSINSERNPGERLLIFQSQQPLGIGHFPCGSFIHFDDLRERFHDAGGDESERALLSYRSIRTSGDPEQPIGLIQKV